MTTCLPHVRPLPAVRLASRAIFVILLILLLGLGVGAAQAQDNVPGQPTQLSVTHRSGQTFITWREISNTPAAMYRVYRHTSPINAGNRAQAQFLYEVPTGSSRFYANRYYQPTGYIPRYVENLVISDNGTPLANDVGLLVWTLEAADFGGGSSGSRYYAVTTKLDGVENTTTFGAGNATAAATTESIADPLPVRINVGGTDAGRHIYIQYMNLRRWNPTFNAPNMLNNYYSFSSADPRVANAIQYMYDYAVFEPRESDCGGMLPANLPVNLILHAWGGNWYGPASRPNAGCAYSVLPIDVSETWYLGFAQKHDYRKGGAIAADDSIANYTEERILRMIYDLSRRPLSRPVDMNRVFVYGHSMGASGTVAFALRYPNVFAAAYANQPMTDYTKAGGWLGNVQAKWGTVAQNLPVVNRAPNGWADHLEAYDGTGVFDWQNHQANLTGRAETDEFAPLSIVAGLQDTSVPWTTQGQPVYAALNDAKMVWGGVVADVGHTWIGFGGLPTSLAVNNGQPFFGWSVRRNETMPGLSNNSGNLAIPPAAAGDYNRNVRWSSSWDPWDGAPIDTPVRWAMSLCYNKPGDPTCGSGGGLTVDVTVRRPQQFEIVPRVTYAWQNRRVSDGALVDAGKVTADANGRLTVPRFKLNASAGNRLIIVGEENVVHVPLIMISSTSRGTPMPEGE